MFGFTKKWFIRLLTCAINASNNVKFASSSNQKCMTQPTLVNLYSNEYSQGLCYYPFAVNLDIIR